MKKLTWYITAIIGTLAVVTIVVPISVLILLIFGPFDLLIIGYQWSRDLPKNIPTSTCVFTVIPDALKALWERPRS